MPLKSHVRQETSKCSSVRIELNFSLLENILKCFKGQFCEIYFVASQHIFGLINLLGADFETMQYCKNRTWLFIWTKRRDDRSGPPKRDCPNQNGTSGHPSIYPQAKFLPWLELHRRKACPPHSCTVGMLSSCVAESKKEDAIELLQ